VVKGGEIQIYVVLSKNRERKKIIGGEYRKG
jgi:hypothetical protein